MDRFLNFGEIEEECREKYKKSPLDYDWSDKNKEIFFRDRTRAYSHYIKLIINEEYPSLQEMKLKWVILGDFFEFLIKICLLKENWSNLGIIYNSERKEFYGFEIPKQILIDSLKHKLNERGLKRIREILDFVQLQRNNFVHNPIVGNDHYALESECLNLILSLNKLYSLGFLNKEVIKIKARIKNLKTNNRGINFEEVGRR